MGRSTPPRLQGNASLSEAVEAAARRTMRTLALERIVLILACVPVVLGPPLVALFLIAREGLRSPSFRLADYSTSAMIAVLNLILSVLILRHLGGELIVVLKAIGLWVQQTGTIPSVDVPLRSI